MISIEAIEEAEGRIKPYVRRTPFIRARHTKDKVGRSQLLLKLENLQVTGAFKVRGAVNAAFSLGPERVKEGVIAASGGNHAVAVAYAANQLGTTAHVIMPSRALPEKIAQVKRWGGSVEIIGDTWDDAHVAALEKSATRGMPYIHPFDDDIVMAGQGTIGLEMMKQSPDCNTFVVAIGGGGLIGGIASAIKSQKPDAKIFGVEPVGAPTMTRSLESGRAIRLPKIETDAITLAPRQSAARNIGLARDLVDDILLVTDEQMVDAARWLWLEFGLSVELSGAAAIAAVKTSALAMEEKESIGAIVCGAGTDGIQSVLPS